MNTATRILLLAALCGSTLALSDWKWTKLHARWSAGNVVSYIAGSAFFDIPTTQAEAEKEKWVQARGDNTTSLWCLKDDPRVCTIYDHLGSIAGMQVCFPQDDVDTSPYVSKNHEQMVEDNVFGIKVACGRFFFIPEDVIKAGRSSFSEIGNGLWIQDGDSITKMPSTGDELEAHGWTKESCIPSMGRHYYYNISETMDCQSMEPYFLLTHDSTGKIHGLGYQSFGKLTYKDRKWMEDVPPVAVRPTIPNAPQCLVDWAGKYGVLSLHVYFVPNPYFITCPLFG